MKAIPEARSCPAARPSRLVGAARRRRLTSTLLERAPPWLWAARRAGGYLEGRELASYLLGEVLAVLTELALLGGLGHGVLELRAQLQEDSTRLSTTKCLPRLRPGTTSANAIVTPGTCRSPQTLSGVRR